MTPQEFKAWFEGYSEGIEDAPTQKQWKRIKSRVAEIDGVVTTKHVFHDRYWHYPRYYESTFTMPYSTVTCQSAISNTGYVGVSGALMNVNTTTEPAVPITSNAFVQLGLLDAQADVTAI